ncbi:CocE/NonD family hydrolase [Pseudemcibacter sp.]|uniref:CocE/NonD family hydrolase n=1 Tax=Pseudemcibacter sp. TaxID=2943293 RepID=UPI003F6A17ED
MTLKRLSFVILFILCLDKSAFAKYNLGDQYSKSEFKITMRDGKKLHTIVYSPKDTSTLYPILLFRTPYSISPYGPDDLAVPEKMIPHPDMISKGYIFAFQDARGTFKSEGKFSDIRPPSKTNGTVDESTDNYDTIEYLINNIENNNGRVGQWGISHPGWYTVMGMISAHPALKAASPQATTGDPFIGDDAHRNGIYRLMPRMAWAYQQVAGTASDRDDPAKILVKPDFGTNWGYEFFLNAGPIDKINEIYFNGQLGSEWEDVIAHPNYDEYYQRRHIPKYMKNVLVPTLNVMGWFDAPDPYGTIATYQGIENLSPNNKSTLVGGPWVHGGWLSSKGEEVGEISFGQKTSDYYNKNILVPFFEYHLKGSGNYQVVEAHMFETGGNKWHRFEQWPPKAMKATPLYFNDDFTLTFDKPETNGKDSYINNPMLPVPYSTKIEFGYAYGAYRIEDQRIASTRQDVLSYSTKELDSDVTIAGPVLAKLITETTGTDADWFIKVIDVFPASDENNPGYHMLVGAEGMRAKYRKSFSNPEPVKPNEETQINFEVRDKFHTFKAGHKIMVQVHSTWFPVYDRNPGQFMNIYGAHKEDYIKTKQTIHRKVQNSSHLVLPVLVR